MVSRVYWLVKQYGSHLSQYVLRTLLTIGELGGSLIEFDISKHP